MVPFLYLRVTLVFLSISGLDRSALYFGISTLSNPYLSFQRLTSSRASSVCRVEPAICGFSEKYLSRRQHKSREKSFFFTEISHKQNLNNRNCAASIILGAFSHFDWSLSRNHSRNQRPRENRSSKYQKNGVRSRRGRIKQSQ